MAKKPPRSKNLKGSKTSSEKPSQKTQRQKRTLSKTQKKRVLKSKNPVDLTNVIDFSKYLNKKKELEEDEKREGIAKKQNLVVASEDENFPKVPYRFDIREAFNLGKDFPINEILVLPAGFDPSDWVYVDAEDEWYAYPDELDA